MSTLKGKTIFVVDDEVDIREILSDCLEPTEAIVHGFPDGQEALRAFDIHKPEIILSDGAMPNLDGLALFEEIRKFNQDCTLVLISAYADTLEQKALNAGADAIFTKPFKLHTLNNFLERLVRDGVSRKRRLHARIFCRLKVLTDVFQGERHIQAYTYNVSLGGFFLQMDVGDLPEIGSSLQYELPIQREWTKSVSGRAECRWVRKESDVTGPRGFGLRFIDPSDDLIDGISFLVEKYRPSEDE